MSTTATIFGSFPANSAQGAATPRAYAAVAPVFDSFSRDGASQDTLAASPTHASWLVRIQRAFDRWTESNAQSRADARLWDIARSDPRIMSDLMCARTRDDSESDNKPVVLSLPVMAEIEEAPMRQPRRASVAGHGWGRMIEDAYQHRVHQPRPQHA